MALNQSLKNYINKGNARLFFALLLVTTGIWFIIQLSKTYTTNLSITVQITQAPIDLVLEKKEITLIISSKQTVLNYSGLILNLMLLILN